MEIDSGTTAELQTGLWSLGRPLMSHEPGGWSQLVAQHGLVATSILLPLLQVLAKSSLVSAYSFLPG